MNQVVIIFATGYASWWMILRMWRRPKVAFRAFSARMARIILWADISHCSVCVGDRVLDKQMSGPAYWPLHKYLKHYPTLSHAYIVPTPLPASFQHIHIGGPIRSLQVIHKWVTNGRRGTDDCVGLTVAVLRDAGIEIPKRVFSPKRLDVWMGRKGFRRIDL